MPNFPALILGIFFNALLVSQAYALPPTSDDFDDLIIGGTQFYVPPEQGKKEPSIAIAETQILLDQRGFSPGVIDGLDTRRFRLALATHNRERPDEKIQISLIPTTNNPLLTTYKITAEDIAGPFTSDIPALYIDQAKLPHLGFRNVVEMLAERFHMDEGFLRSLNKKAVFDEAGTIIRVANVGRDLQTRVARLEADKSKLQVRAFDENDNMIAAYPASIGSQSTPSPTGTHKVKNKAQNPRYTYDPNGSAQPGLSKGLVRLPAGPNSPVGNAWIGLSKPTYGIHGTPEPSQIGVTASVGCIRLTNWDALELARLLRRGVAVSFIE
ncbi:MAG: L,D-transpeptidase [Pseudomonadota bacterium]